MSNSNKIADTCEDNEADTDSIADNLEDIDETIDQRKNDILDKGKSNNITRNISIIEANGEIKVDNTDLITTELMDKKKENYKDLKCT